MSRPLRGNSIGVCFTGVSVLSGYRRDSDLRGSPASRVTKHAETGLGGRDEFTEGFAPNG